MFYELLVRIEFSFICTDICHVRTLLYAHHCTHATFFYLLSFWWHLLLITLVRFPHFSAGGLVTAVAPVVISGNGVWVGWPGMHMENPNEPIPESDPNDRTPTAGLLSRKVGAFFYIFSSYTIFIEWTK